MNSLGEDLFSGAALTLKHHITHGTGSNPGEFNGFLNGVAEADNVIEV